MARSSVTLEGFSELEAVLVEKADAVRVAAAEAVAEEAELAVEDAKAHAAVRSGALRDGIEAELEGSHATIGSKVRHGAANEFGTSKMPAHPFMGPAAELSRKRFPEGAASRIRKAVE